MSQVARRRPERRSGYSKFYAIYYLINSYWALIVPALYSSYSVSLVRQFVHSIPDELIDAARIDGSSEPGIFLRNILPLAKPAMAALGIINFGELGQLPLAPDRAQ